MPPFQTLSRSAFQITWAYRRALYEQEVPAPPARGRIYRHSQKSFVLVFHRWPSIYGYQLQQRRKGLEIDIRTRT